MCRLSAAHDMLREMIVDRPAKSVIGFNSPLDVEIVQMLVVAPSVSAVAMH